jgi:chromosome segregation ATPase
MDDSTTPPRSLAPKTEEQSRLHGTVENLTEIARDLEQDLAKMVAANEALQQEWDQERQRTSEASKQNELLMEDLARLEQKTNSTEELRAEVAHLESERRRLGAVVDELGRQLGEAERERQTLQRRVEHLRLRKQDVLDDQRIVEAQFERTMKMVDEQKARLSLLAEECDGLRSRVRAHESQARLTQRQRDLLSAEVEDSARALEEIRAFLKGASLLHQSQGEP